MKIHTLLIGINEYKSLNINNLQGCVPDVNKVAELLQQNFSGVEISTKKLINQQASKANIIKAFSEHFQEAQEGDSVLIYYSGHGSTESGEIFGEKQNETIICHDSRTDNIYDLADKELAVLISQIPKKTHIALCFDSCHSGDITRHLGLQPRHTPNNNALTRNLATYYGYEGQTTPKVPESPHIVLSACSPTEVAWENAEGGVFTTQLLKTLKEYKNKPISYNKLFRYLKLGIRQTYSSTLQTPQFDRGNPQTAFLTGEKLEDEESRHYLSFNRQVDKNIWEMDAGALNGIVLPENSNEKSIQVYDNNTLIGDFAIQNLQLNTTLLKDLSVLDENKTYACFQKPLKSAQLLSIYIELKNNENGKPKLTKNFIQVDQKEEADFWLFGDDHLYEIYEAKEEKLVVKHSDLKQVETDLKQIGIWQNVRTLQNTSTNFNPNQVDIKWKAKINDQWEATKRLNHGDALEYRLETQESKIPYHVSLQNNTDKDIYAALVCFLPFYGIFVLGTREVNHNAVKVLKNEEAVLYHHETEGLVLLPEQRTDNFIESEALFKVIMSTEPFDLKDLPRGYLQSTAGKSFMDIKSRFSNEISKDVIGEDWFAQDFRVDISLKNVLKTLDKNQDIQLSKNIHIKSNHISTDISYKQSYEPSRGIEQYNPWPILEEIENLQIINIQEDFARDINPPNIIQLDNLNFDSGSEQSIEIQIAPELLSEDEYYLPFAMVEGNFVPIGSFDEEDPKKVKVDYFPETEENARTKNIGRALKFTLLKFKAKIFGQQEAIEKEIFSLRAVNYTNEEEDPLYDTFENVQEIKDKVKASTKGILLLIHGIIGNTGEMVKFAKHLRGHYDCILTFDYENLNTGIEVIVSKLKTRLEDVGIFKDGGKKIDILAHSMGGLVSRYLIEKDGGKDFVNRLIMCGTPNGGSVFGKIDSIRNGIGWIATLASMYFSPAVLVKSIATMIGVTKTIAKTGATITHTLKQMDKNSEFLKSLNQQGNDSEIPYYIIAGNIQQYQNKVFIDNAYRVVGRTLYGKDTAHDIAVLTDDILEQGKNEDVTKQIVPCHHLNYFSEEPSMNELFKILKNQVQNES